MKSKERAPGSNRNRGRILTAPLKILKIPANIIGSIGEHPRAWRNSVLAVGAAAAGGYLAEEITWGGKIEKFQAQERFLIDQDVKRGANCLSDGLKLHAGVNIRETPGLIKPGLGKLSQHIGIMKGNVSETIKPGKTMVIKQPRLVPEGDNEWAFFTKGKPDDSAKSVETIAEETYMVNLRAFRTNETNTGGQRLITTYDVASTPPDQGFTVPCQIDQSGQTEVNGIPAAYGLTYDTDTFEQAIDLQK